MKHLTLEQRYIISLMIAQGKSQKEIALTIGKHKSVVSREQRRNCDQRSGNYNHELAQRKYRQRLQNKAWHIRFTQEVKKYVEANIRQYLSPEQIVGLAKREKICCVSHERIYQHIWEDKERGVWEDKERGGDLYKPKLRIKNA